MNKKMLHESWLKGGEKKIRIHCLNLLFNNWFL